MEKEILLSVPHNKNHKWIYVLIGTAFILQSISHYGNSNVLFIITLVLGLSLIIISLIFYNKLSTNNYVIINNNELIYKQNIFKQKKIMLWGRIKKIQASMYRMVITYEDEKEYIISFTEMGNEEKHIHLIEFLKLIEDKGKTLPNCSVKY